MKKKEPHHWSCLRLVEEHCALAGDYQGVGGRTRFRSHIHLDGYSDSDDGLTCHRYVLSTPVHPQQLASSKESPLNPGYRPHRQIQTLYPSLGLPYR